MKGRGFPCILNSRCITESPLVQSDCIVYWSAGNLQGSLLLFLFSYVWRYSDKESVKEKWDFGTGWNRCEMKILMMLSLWLKLHIWKHFSFQVIWETQTKATWKCALFWIWDNLHHLVTSVSFREAKISLTSQVFLCFIIGKVVPNCKTHHIYTFLHLQEILSLDFLEMNFPKFCSGHCSVKCYVWEKV